MQGNFLTSVTAVAVSATLGVATLAAAQTAPPMGGGYTNVIPIPVGDPNIKAIAGALFKPEGAGPFPGVVFMSGCAGLSPPPDMAMQKTVIDHLLAKGVAVLMVDPFTPRNEPEGICAPRRQRRGGGTESPQSDAGRRPQPDLPARLFMGGDILALRHGPEHAECARRQDRGPRRLLSLLL